MSTVNILEGDDEILPDDWIRPLSFVADYTMTDHVTYESCYGGGPADHMRWIPVWLRLGNRWWGDTVENYQKVTQKYGGSEIIRGDPPAAHIMNIEKWWHRHPMWATDHMGEWHELRDLVVGFGKHGHRTLGYLQTRDTSYLQWLADRANHAGAARLLHLGRLDEPQTYSYPDAWLEAARKPTVFPWPKVLVGMTQAAGVMLIDVKNTGMWLCERIAPLDPFVGYYATPGGKLEPGESPKAGIARELLEETGITRSKGQKFLKLHTGEYNMPDGTPYVLYQYALLTEMVPANTETDKHGPWTFYEWAAVNELKLMPSIVDALAKWYA